MHIPNPSRLGSYSKKYGLPHALAAGLGRSVPWVWRHLGEAVSRDYVERYLRTNTFRLLNLGSGSHCIEGMLNVDIDPRADAYVDITRPLPLPDASFNRIFCEEVLEHVTLNSGLQLLRECHRILRPGGVLRLTTPSLEYFASGVVEGETLGDEINAIFYEHGHRHIYSRLALIEHLKRTGYSEIRFSHYRDPDSVLGKCDSHADRFNHRPEISHYVEASKAGAHVANGQA